MTDHTYQNALVDLSGYVNDLEPPNPLVLTFRHHHPATGHFPKSLSRLVPNFLVPLKRSVCRTPTPTSSLTPTRVPSSPTPPYTRQGVNPYKGGKGETGLNIQ